MKSSNLITIFTPTYNRATLLGRLYDSLINQSFNNFEWIIVDDGSSDNTEEVVQTFLKEDKLAITYVKQQNSGKHIAINTGLDHAQGEWFFIVDSDDYLIPDALKIVNEYLAKNTTYNYDGFAFRRAYEGGTSIGGEFPEGIQEFAATIIERTVKYRVSGDMAEVFKTDLLRECKFDEGFNEKFCAEGLMLNRTAKLGAKLLYIDQYIYICEYLPGGLTDNSVGNRRRSPKYATMVYKELAEVRSLPIKYKLKAYSNYWRFSFFINCSWYEKIRNINGSFLGLISLPFGYIMKLKDDFNLKKIK
ncbi:glycosyltransferase family 2 protein [Sphingobacterium faecium]|uniref:glycosyltransferase family 2 protein n=1 Tax=Sphingobacterium faecium TaxID=34087 RepID=UPI0024685D0F|nr:glycosyltransferase family 2 protein [Sphingobacterium faecium]MDH5828698.1 glycosyltransferase [Sphingobacterium faecium]